MVAPFPLPNVEAGKLPSVRRPFSVTSGQLIERCNAERGGRAQSRGGGQQQDRARSSAFCQLRLQDCLLFAINATSRALGSVSCAFAQLAARGWARKGCLSAGFYFRQRRTRDYRPGVPRLSAFHMFAPNAWIRARRTHHAASLGVGRRGTRPPADNNDMPPIHAKRQDEWTRWAEY